MHAYMHTCIHAYIRTCIHAYMHICIHAYMHTCTNACMHTCIHAYMHTYIHYIPTYTHTHLHAFFVHEIASCNNMYNVNFSGGSAMQYVGKVMLEFAASELISMAATAGKMHNGGQARHNRNCGTTAKEDTTATAEQV